MEGNTSQQDFLFYFDGRKIMSHAVQSLANKSDRTGHKGSRGNTMEDRELIDGSMQSLKIASKCAAEEEAVVAAHVCLREQSRPQLP